MRHHHGRARCRRWHVVRHAERWDLRRRRRHKHGLRGDHHLRRRSHLHDCHGLRLGHWNRLWRLHIDNSHGGRRGHLRWRRRMAAAVASAVMAAAWWLVLLTLRPDVFLGSVRNQAFVAMNLLDLVVEADVYAGGACRGLGR